VLLLKSKLIEKRRFQGKGNSIFEGMVPSKTSVKAMIKTGLLIKAFYLKHV
jgi:hypothetical protein